MTDFFISHASEDKSDIARPLSQALKGRGHSVWFDEYTLRLGDSLPQEIDRGLAACRRGVVILSKAFFAKQWPQRELDGLITREVNEQTKRILPVWHGVDRLTVAQFSPTLASRLAVSTAAGLDEVVRQIEAALDVAPEATARQTSQVPASVPSGGAPTYINVPPGYERRLNHHLYRIAREKAARNEKGGFTYPVVVKGRDEDIRSFNREFIQHHGVHPMVTSSSQGVGELEFTYSGAHGPETVENLALKHRLTIIRCGNPFSV